MKTLAFTLLLLCTQLLPAQEFADQTNGLIYSDKAIEKLASIVDVKNGEFRRCDLSKQYVANEQTIGFFIDVERFKTSKIESLIKSDPSVEDLLASLGMEDSLNYRLLVKGSYENYEGEKMVQIRQEPTRKSISIAEKKYAQADFGSYILDQKSKILVCLKNPFEAKALPNKYARQMQYADCLIDTTTTVFEENAAHQGGRRPTNQQKRIRQDRLFTYVNENFPFPKPKYPITGDFGNDTIQKVDDSIQVWEKAKRKFVSDDLVNREKFKKLFEEAYAEACENKNSSDEFEHYVALIRSYDAALELKRNRIVIGSCSMDQSPRFHAQNIAKLSAETYRWDIFLRAHLDIMNDNVSRISDGSWALDGRKTYIKELEALNIDVVDLVMGISYRSSNADSGHYIGAIDRLGRAISESAQLHEFETTILEAIADETLDDYNRLICYYLYDNLQWHKDLDEAKEQYNRTTAETVACLPTYLRPKKA